jgi:hypothetical protein
MNLYLYLTNRIPGVYRYRLKRSMDMSRKTIRDMEEAAIIFKLHKQLLT